MKRARLIELGFGKFRLEMLDGMLIEEGNAAECCVAKERFGLSIEEIIDRSPKMTYRAIMSIIHPDKHNGNPAATRLSQILNSMRDRVDEFCGQYGDEILAVEMAKTELAEGRAV